MHSEIMRIRASIESSDLIVLGKLMYHEELGPHK